MFSELAYVCLHLISEHLIYKHPKELSCTRDLFEQIE